MVGGLSSSERVHARALEVRAAGCVSLRLNPSWWRRLAGAEGPPQPGDELFGRDPARHAAIVERVLAELEPCLAYHAERGIAVRADRLFDDALLYLCVRGDLPIMLPGWTLGPGQAAAGIRPIDLVLAQLVLTALDELLEVWKQAWRTDADDPSAGGWDAPAWGFPSHVVYLALENVTEAQKEQLTLRLLEYVLERVFPPGASAPLSYWAYTCPPTRAQRRYVPFEQGLLGLARRRATELLPGSVEALLKSAEAGPAELRDALTQLTAAGLEEQLAALRVFFADALEDDCLLDEPALVRLDAAVREARERARQQLPPEQRACLRASGAGPADQTAFVATAASARGSIARAVSAESERRRIYEARRRAKEAFYARMRQECCRERLAALAQRYADRSGLLEDFARRFRQHHATLERGPGGRDPVSPAVRALLDRLVEQAIGLVRSCCETTRSFVEIAASFAGEPIRPGRSRPKSVFGQPDGVAEALVLTVAALELFVQCQGVSGRPAPSGGRA
jgi:hypothetical protein